MNRLTEADIENILLEDIPDLNAPSDVDSDSDEEAEVLSQTSNFDEVFNNQMKRLEQHQTEEEISILPNPPIEKASSSKTIHVPDRKWKKKDNVTVIPDYILPEGVIEECFASCQTPTDVIMILLKPLVEHVTFQSNLYATQNNKTLNLKEHELLAFIGINFLMGYHVLPSWKDYWNTSADLNVPIIVQTMPRNRFEEILRFLHCNDNTAIPVGCVDKLYKIRPIITSANNTFSEVYHGTREVSVDESIIKFKGRHSIKQYNPMKPIKRGYKLWSLADQLGFTMKFDVYQGKDEALEEEFKDYGLGERVVLKITKDLWNKNRIIFFDNYYTSLPLLEFLKTQNTLACGTIRGNRKGLPSNMECDKALKRGSSDYRFSSLDIGVFKWMDNKIVTIASNYHGSEDSVVKRTAIDGKKKEVTCPLAVDHYNKFMGGVDLADRLRALYCIDRKSRKWWHRLFFGILDIYFVNTYVISNKIFSKSSVLETRRSIARGLMTQKMPLKRKSVQPMETIPTKRRNTGMSVPNDVRLGNRGVHWPLFTSKRGRCEWCSIKKIESRPFSICSNCKIFLCCNEKKNCMKEYHEI
jgi:hypothetical protein